MKRAGLVLLALAGLWGAGFLAFVVEARRATPAPGVADGIVALTGGADRVATALQLLADRRAPVLLISGVGHGTDVPALLHAAGLASDPEPGPVTPGQVTLGRLATTTAGNAAETAAWAQANRLRSLLVVTAGYHMPRALLEIGRVLPGTALHPVPVQPQAVRSLRDPAIWRLLAGEYSKWLAVRLGVAPLLRELRTEVDHP